MPKVAERLKAIGCKFAGCVDTSGTWGHVRFAKELDKAGVTPAFGREFQLPTEDGRKPICWALATDLKAFYRFSSSHPTAPEDFANGSGMVRFAGSALSDPETFDYIDLNPASIFAAQRALALAKRTQKPLVLTSDNDFPGPEDRELFLAWVDSQKMTPQHILGPSEWRSAFSWLDDTTFKKAVSNTIEVAERVGELKLQKAPIISVTGNLKKLVEEGRKYRLAAGHISEWTKDYADRLEREMAMIKQKKYESYFIVVSDLVRWAKSRMLVGPARGSSAGSLVCYLLRITEVDPLPHDLLFERFIDVNRHDLPDIDIDFADTKRHLVFDYLKDKYGSDNVAKIGSLNTLKPRSVMAHVGKKLGIPHAATYAVLNVLIEYSSGDSRYGKGLEDTLKNTQPGKDFSERYPEAMIMGQLENHASHTGVHAAGIIVSNEPVIDYCTVNSDGVAQLDKKDAEELNLLKIDALGLRTLGVIEDTGCIDAETLYSLPLDDPEVFQVINDGKFSGIFQFEGSAQRSVARVIPIDSFKTIDHVTALARPGPLGGGAAHHYAERNAGRERITYRHESMKDYLSDTMGVVLYQEQVMRIVREIGNFSWEDTSTIRKAMSARKGQEFFNQHGKRFAEGAARLGINAKEANDIWNEICNFGAWGMNRSLCGDTKVKLCHPNQFLGKDPTIKEVYAYYKVNPSSWIRQRKAMPKLLCLDDNGVARPTPAVDLTYNGIKACVKLRFEDGREVVCSRNHKFIINGEWKRCGNAAAGDQFESCARQFEREFRERMRREPCSGCGELKDRMVVHHNDHCHGKERPDDLAWVCDGCHKRIHMTGEGWAAPYARGWRRGESAVLASIESVGERETYDIHMPEPYHNYLLANGIVTHNSHTTSYAIISYWCAYMKRHFPIEYAAACLRNAKDDEQVIELLRELNAEGVEYVPFDPMLSEANWSAKEGKLVGGYSGLVGIGPVKAAKYIEKRNGPGLTEKDLTELAKLPIKHNELRPAHKMWGDLYDDPESMNVHGRIKEFGELADRENAVVIAMLVKKERRDDNEAARIAKRNGEVKRGQTLFLDMFVVDDSVSRPIRARIQKRDWLRLGVPIADRARDGVDWFLIRGQWLEAFTMFSVTKIKPLNNQEIFQ